MRHEWPHTSYGHTHRRRSHYSTRRRRPASAPEAGLTPAPDERLAVPDIAAAGRSRMRFATSATPTVGPIIERRIEVARNDIDVALLKRPVEERQSDCAGSLPPHHGVSRTCRFVFVPRPAKAGLGCVRMTILQRTADARGTQAITSPRAGHRRS